MYTVTGKEFLIDKILNVVNMIRTVKEEQIFRMFRLYGTSTVEHQLAALACAHKINYNRETGIITSRMQPPWSAGAQEMLTYAFWVLAAFGDDRIDSFWLKESPSQLLWIERDNQTIRDLTVMHFSNMAGIGYLWLANRDSCIPKKGGKLVVPDICEHIALLYAKSDLKEAQKYEFDRYCVLDKETYEPIFIPDLKQPVLPRKRDEDVTFNAD